MLRLIFIFSLLATPAYLLNNTEIANAEAERITSGKMTADVKPAARKVYIFNVVASPTEKESVTLKNSSGTKKDISGWTLGDKNKPDAYKIPKGTVLEDTRTIRFNGATLKFSINDSGETLYLKDAEGKLVDTWTN